MAIIIFYEKPGCVNNTKQKVILHAAGHAVKARNLLTQSWSSETLYQFLKDRPLREWFNRMAPQIRDGEIIPEKLDEETALELMLKYPILIRRPLIQIGDRYTVGFDLVKLNAWMGLKEPQPSVKDLDLETCPKVIGKNLVGNCRQ
jgi:nitrogenase-associated protein